MAPNDTLEKEQPGARVPKRTYQYFKELVKHRTGGIRGQLGPALNDAIKLYVASQVIQDPDAVELCAMEFDDERQAAEDYWGIVDQFQPELLRTAQTLTRGDHTPEDVGAQLSDRSRANSQSYPRALGLNDSAARSRHQGEIGQSRRGRHPSEAHRTSDSPHSRLDPSGRSDASKGDVADMDTSTDQRDVPHKSTEQPEQDNAAKEPGADLTEQVDQAIADQVEKKVDQAIADQVDENAD